MILRRMPWNDSDGRPVVVDTEHASPLLLRTADETERQMLADARAVARHSLALLNAEVPFNHEFVIKRLIEAVDAAVRVAEARAGEPGD